MNVQGSHPAAPTVIWLGAILVALAGSLTGVDVGIPAAVGGAVVALTVLRGPLAGRLLTAAAMAPIAFVDSSPAVAWAGACAGIGFATSMLVSGQSSTPSRGDLQRHLEWCRRREEGAHILVVPLSSVDAHELSGLVESFRITDSVTLGKENGGVELYALLDDKDFVREGIERRLSELRAGRASFGWATFPQDGVTIQTLIEHARAQMRAAARQATVHEAPQPAPAPAPIVEHAAGRS
jgi:hypothetical protein